MKESKAVYVTKRDIKLELRRDYQLYSNRAIRDTFSTDPLRYDQKTLEVGCQYDSKRDNLICTCRNLATLRKKQEVRYFGLPKQIYAYHGSRSYTDIGVGSVKALQRKKVKRIYLPETDDRGVGSSELSSYFIRRSRQHRGNSYYDNKRTSSKCVGGILEYNTGCVMNEKLSPIVQTVSGSTSPRDSTFNRNTEIGSNTIGKSLINTTTQVEDILRKEIEINPEVKVEEVNPVLIIQEDIKEMKTKTIDIEQTTYKPTERKGKETVKEEYSSDSLVQHVHNLESPSDEKQSHLSMDQTDPMENKLEREYRRIFAAKSKDTKSSNESRPLPDFKSTSTLKRGFEALRRGLAKKEDSKKNAVIVTKVSSQISVPSRKDVSINSDPPSLESRSYSNTKTYSPYVQSYSRDKTMFNPRVSSYRRSITSRKERDSAQWSSRPNDEDSESQGVKGMFKLWGKKFNLEEDSYKRRATPKPSFTASKKTVQKVEQSKIVIKPDTDEKKEGRKFFFFKKKNKDREKPYKSKKGVTAGRCELRDGLMIKLGGGGSVVVPEDIVKEPEVMPPDYEDMVRKAWLKKFLSHAIDSRNSVQVRWNNKTYATSSSTVFELMDNVYKDTGVVFRSKSQVTVQSSYKSYTKQHVNFVHQNIEAWMIPKTITDRPRLLPAKIKCKSDENRKDNIEVRISDQKWFIDKSKAFSHKIEVVLHSKNFVKLNKKESSEYLRIDIPKGFFIDSSSDDNDNKHPANQSSDEEVYKIVEYETGSDLKKDKPIRNFDIGDHNQNNIKVTVSVKESKVYDSKTLETMIKRPTVHRDVVIQGSNVYIPKRCDVIGVGIITQRDLREIRKPILKIQDDFSDEESEHNMLKPNQKKCEFAESYLQDYYRNWTPLGIDLYSWCVSDSHLRCCSDNSRVSFHNQGDGTKSCPNIFDDFQTSTMVSSCGASSCSQCNICEETCGKAPETSTWFGKFKKKSKDSNTNSSTRRILPKDSIEVFRRRKIYAASDKSKWGNCCPEYDRSNIQPYSIPSIESKGAQNTLTECPKLMKSCCKPIEPRPRKRTCKKHVSLPDCDTMNDLLAKQLTDALPEGILAFKGSSGCDQCKKKSPCPKHAKVNPESCEIPRAPCRDSCEQMKKPPCGDSSISCEKPPCCPPPPPPCRTPSCPPTPPPCRTPSCPTPPTCKKPACPPSPPPCKKPPSCPPTPPPCKKPPSCPPSPPPCKKPSPCSSTPSSCPPTPPPCKKKPKPCPPSPPPCKKPPSCPPSPPPCKKPSPCSSTPSSCPPTPPPCKKKAKPCPPTPPPCKKPPSCPPSPPPCKKPSPCSSTPSSCPPTPPPCKKKPKPCPPSPPPCKKPPSCPPSPPPCKKPSPCSSTPSSCPPTPPPCKKKAKPVPCPSPPPKKKPSLCNTPPCKKPPPCPEPPPPCKKKPPCPPPTPPCKKPPSCPPSPPPCKKKPSKQPCPPSPPPCKKPPPCPPTPPCKKSPTCPPSPPPCKKPPPCPPSPPSCPHIPPCSPPPRSCPHTPPCPPTPPKCPPPKTPPKCPPPPYPHSPPPCPYASPPCPHSPPPCPHSPPPCPYSPPPCPHSPPPCPYAPPPCPYAPPPCPPPPPTCPHSPPPCPRFPPPPCQPKTPPCPHSPPCTPPPPPCYRSSKPCPASPPFCPASPPICCYRDPNQCPALPPPCKKASSRMGKKRSRFFKKKMNCPASPPCKPTPCQQSFCNALACQPSPCKPPSLPSPCQKFSNTSCSFGSVHPTPDAPYVYSPVHPCPPEYEKPPKKATPCSSEPCNKHHPNYKQPLFECQNPSPTPFPESHCDQCRTTDDFPWPTKNQVSNQSSVTSLYPAHTSEPGEPVYGTCKKNCPMMPKLSCETVPSPKKECKLSCPNRQGSPRPPCMPEMQCPVPKCPSPPPEPPRTPPSSEAVKCKSKSKMSGLYLKMMPSKKKTCSRDCMAWSNSQADEGCISLNSQEKITIRLKKETPSTEEIREGLNIKVQDEDGMTLFERKDYRLQHDSCRHSVLGDMYKASEVRRITTNNSVQAIGSDLNCRREIIDSRSDASIANLIEIQFKLKVTQGEKTTEINIANDGDKENEGDEKSEKDDQINKTPQEVFVVKEGCERPIERPDQKNDINIRIVIKNFKPKSGKKKLLNIKRDDYSKEFSKKISAKFHTVSTGYSDVLHDDNVFSVHRATVDLTSSVDKSKTYSNKSEEMLSEPLTEHGRGILMGSNPSTSRCITTDMSDCKIEKAEVKSIPSKRYSVNKETQEYTETDTEKPTERYDTEETDTDKPIDHKYDTEETDTDKPPDNKYDTEETDTDKPPNNKYDTEETDTEKPHEHKYDTEETDTDKPIAPKYDTFMSTDTDEQDVIVEKDTFKDKSNSIEVIVKPHTKDEKKEMLKHVMEKAHETKPKQKTRMKKLRDMLKVILTSDSSDHDDSKLRNTELAKDVTYASLKPNYFKDSDSMNNYYRQESNVMLSEGEINKQVVYPTVQNNSECSNSNPSEVLSSENETPNRGCMCSTLAARLKLASRIGEGGGCCCRPKSDTRKNEETTCDILKNESDFFKFDYNTCQTMDVETQNSRYLTSKMNSTNLSLHRSIKSSIMDNLNMSLDVKTDSGIINVDDRNFPPLRKTFSPHMNHVRECEMRKLTRNTLLGISDEDKIVMLSDNPTRMSTTSTKAKVNKRKYREAMTILHASDILQSYETKKAVLEIYTEKTVSDEGEHLVAKLPKFVYDRENEIQTNYEAIATNTYKAVCKRNIVMMAINR